MNGTFYITAFKEWHETENEKFPDVSFVPPLMRRRLSAVEKIGISLASAVCPSVADPSFAVVFASRYGEWNNTVKLIKQYKSDREMSPAVFSSSVHNAMPGIFSMLMHNKAEYTTVAAKERTFNDALIEAFIGPKPVLFIYAEEATPEFYQKTFKNPFGGHGIAFFLSEEKKENSLKTEFVSSYNGDILCSFADFSAFLNGAELLKGSHFTLRCLK